MDRVDKLFSGKWNKLKNDISGFKNIKYPGVYMLAYSTENLIGKKVRVGDVFYIGMSNSRGGIEQRIYQFIDSINGGGGHSAGTRFYVDYCRKNPYGGRKNNKLLYFTYVSVPCEARKDTRKANDLRLMGEVARLEYFALAHVKEHIGNEPELNKK